MDIFELIDRAASHFKALLSAVNMTAHRKCFYPRFSSYCGNSIHLLDLIPFKECLITQDIIMLAPHVICHLKAIVNTFQ